MQALEGAGQTGKHAPDFGAALEKSALQVAPQVVASHRNDNLCLDLHQGPVGYGQMMEIVAEMIAPVPFGNVGRDRDCCTSHLGGQSVDFATREVLGRLVDLEHQIHRPPPHQQVPISVNRWLRCCMPHDSP